MKKLLDTTFLVHFLTRKRGVEPYLAAHDGPETEFIVSMISMKELAVGVHHVEEEPTVSDLRANLGWVTVLPFSIRHAFAAGEIEEAFNRQSLPREKLNALGGDILIGGVALAENAPVVTRNTGDFELMTGVTVERY